MAEELNLLSKADAAKMLKVCQRTIDYLRQKEGLPFVKMGGTVRFLKADLIQWIQSKKIQGKKEGC